MSKITTDSYVARRLAQTASLKAAAALKRIRNDAASEREHLRLMRKVEQEFDGSLGRGGILKRGLARIKTNSLTVPAERKRQLLLSTSGRSFHGRGTTYRKERPTTDAKKRRRAASSGAAHYRYIEDTGHYEPQPNELLIAASTGSHASYIDGCRVETTDDGDRLSSTNIEGGFVERMRFFALAEAFERNSHGDKITLDLNRASAERAAAIADPTCDPALRAAVEQHPPPHNGKPIKIQLKGNNQDLRRLLTKHGMELSKAPKNDSRLATDGIAFHTGRSGRTHFRWVFELPVEFTAEQRKMVLEDLCAHMDREKCMYAAVIHAPDPGNDERNYHLHLIFYDRPCRRLTATEADLKNVDESVKPAIRAEIAAGHIKPGEWDFTVERHYKCKRSWKIHYPFRAEKSRKVTEGKDWKARFRCNYAAIVNEVSVKTGGGPAVYDPRSYNDRDVDISPSKHLGQLHQSEIAGIPTLIGLSNESNQAQDQRRAILARHEVEMTRLDSLEAMLAPYHSKDTVHRSVSRLAAKPLQDLAEARLVAEASLAMELWSLETARERSRATLVRDRQKRASEKGPAHERRQRENLAIAAETHLDKLDDKDASMQRVLAGVQRDIDGAIMITAEAVQRTASNCKTLSRLNPLRAAQKVATEPAQETSVAPPARQALDHRIASKPTALDRLPVAELPAGALDPDALQAGEAAASRTTPADPTVPRKTVSKAPLSLTAPPLGDVVQPTAPAPANDTATLKTGPLHRSTDKENVKGQTILIVPPLPDVRGGLSDAAEHSELVDFGTDVATTGQMPQRTEQSPLAMAADERGDRAPDRIPRPPTASDEVRSDEHRDDIPKGAPPVTAPEHHAETVRNTPADATSMKVYVEKPTPPNASSLYGSNAQSTDLCTADREPAMRRIESERETILHVVRTERIRLKRVNGNLVLPDHKLISADWRRHVPYLQVELARDQRLIEEELKAFVRLIGSNAYDATSARSIFFHEVFKGEAQIGEALAARERSAAERLVQQHTLAAQNGIGM